SGRMKRRALGVAALCSGVLWCTSAWGGVAERVGLKVKGKVQGNDQPKLVFTPTDDVKALTVTMWRGDNNQKIHRALGAVGKGATREMPVSQPTGTFHYKTKVAIVWASGEQDTLRIQFDLSRTAGFSLVIDPAEVDLDGRALSYSLTDKGDRVELGLFDESDASLGVVKRDVSGVEPGTKQTISWPEPKVALAYMKLRAWSEAGFWTETTLKPVSLRIPHQDVVFDSGRAHIKASEEPKLKDTLAKLNEAVKMHAETIGVRLYVAGYCDTVGDAAQNRVLSTQRAKSIAVWFRQHGVKLPTFYQGFGEDVLAVKTPDETAEPRNRRALYLLSTHTPDEASDFPKASWRGL
ncbi:MAG: OmpA family protein, partial [Polyangiaceae bacterium]